jgi:hypothetical protein
VSWKKNRIGTLDPVRVSIVHGLDVHWKDRTHVTVPKATLVSMLVARLHSGELFVHESLKDCAHPTPGTTQFPT